MKFTMRVFPHYTNGTGVKSSSDLVITSVIDSIPFASLFEYTTDSILTLTRLDSGNITANSTSYSSLTFHLVYDSGGNFVKWECDQDNTIYITLSGTPGWPLLTIPGNSPSSDNIVSDYSPTYYYWYGSYYQFTISNNRVCIGTGYNPPFGNNTKFIISKEDGEIKNNSDGIPYAVNGNKSLYIPEIIQDNFKLTEQNIPVSPTSDYSGKIWMNPSNITDGYYFNGTDYVTFSSLEVNNTTEDYYEYGHVTVYAQIMPITHEPYGIPLTYKSYWRLRISFTYEYTYCDFLNSSNNVNIYDTSEYNDYSYTRRRYPVFDGGSYVS